MATLCERQQYALTSHLNHSIDKSLIFVKLTDSALKAIEDYLNHKVYIPLANRFFIQMTRMRRFCVAFHSLITDKNQLFTTVYHFSKHLFIGLSFRKTVASIHMFYIRLKTIGFFP